jgi:hypothetical protein
MLSKLARIIIIAKEVGGVDRVDFNRALNRYIAVDKNRYRF